MAEPTLRELIEQYEASETLLGVSRQLVDHVAAIEELATEPTAAKAKRVTDTLQFLVDRWKDHLQVCDPEAWERSQVALVQLEAAGGLKT